MKNTMLIPQDGESTKGHPLTDKNFEETLTLETREDGKVTAKVISGDGIHLTTVSVVPEGALKLL